MIKDKAPKKLGIKLKKIREHYGYSLEKMAREVGQEGVSKRARVYEWENNIRRPGLLQVLAYAKFAGISTDMLLDDDIRLKLD